MLSFPPSFEVRVLAYALSPLSILRALDMPGFFLCCAERDASVLPVRVAQLSPHVLLFCQSPPDPAGLLARIGQAEAARPPRIAACAACRCEADGRHDDPIRAALLAMTPLCGLLSAASMPAREACVRDMLNEIGMSARLRGADCLTRGAASLSALPLPLPPLQYALYPQLATAFGISSAAVEKRIRGAIESAWLRGSWAAQSRLLGLSVSAERGKPTNCELLCRLADRVNEILFYGGEKTTEERPAPNNSH